MQPQLIYFMQKSQQFVFLSYFRIMWIKGCEARSGITAMNTLLCQADGRRCRYHCDTGDLCNEWAPTNMENHLSQYCYYIIQYYNYYYIEIRRTQGRHIVYK